MRYVRIKKFVELSGYTADAIYQKLSKGVWVEGSEYKRAPDNQVLIDMEGFNRWVEGGQALGSIPSRHPSDAASPGRDGAVSRPSRSSHLPQTFDPQSVY